MHCQYLVTLLEALTFQQKMSLGALRYQIALTTPEAALMVVQSHFASSLCNLTSKVADHILTTDVTGLWLRYQ